ncbi:MAG TPA: NADH-quinone oxidoreductase subunit NuoK [Mycobacteriales bacterium]|jgi:NADH-quinone oxidoreductase subunit K|nr:NADH-quinone oxidoreductase subunit NuoK [Mycobacteriales bacterium]
MHPLVPYFVAAVLFGIGAYGVTVRRNAVLVLMAVELMLNAVNVVLVTADLTVGSVAHGVRTGSAFALFVIVLAAAEIGVALAVVLQLYRTRQTVAVDEVDLEPSADVAPAPVAAEAHR